MINISRFEQIDYKMYSQCEQLLLKVAADYYKSEFKQITNLYGTDFSPLLDQHLEIFAENFGTRYNPKLNDIIKYLRSFNV